MDESVIKGVEGVELNGSDAAVRKSSIIRMVVEGYDGSTDRTDVEEALIKHFASRGIKLIHVSVPEVDKTHTILCRCGLIYLNEEDEEKALKFDGSVMGGRMLRVTAYPFENNRLDHFFSTTEAQDKNLLRALKVTGFDTSLARDVLEEMVRAVFPQSERFSPREGCVFVYLCGLDAIETALKLSGGSVGGFKIVVDSVIPLISRGRSGVSLARRLAMSEGNQKAIMTTY